MIGRSWVEEDAVEAVAAAEDAVCEARVPSAATSRAGDGGSVWK